MCTIFKLIHMLWAGRACCTLSVPPIWRSATTQIRLPNTFHPPKCQMQSRQPERLRLPNYMQLRWRGRGMRLVKQKCGTMKTGSKSWGRNCHNARRIKATKNLPSTPKKTNSQSSTTVLQHGTYDNIVSKTLDKVSVSLWLLLPPIFAVFVAVNFRRTNLFRLIVLVALELRLWLRFPRHERLMTAPVSAEGHI